MDSLKSCCWAHFVTAVFQVGYFVPCVTTIVDLQNVYDEELRILWGGIATVRYYYYLYFSPTFLFVFEYSSTYLLQ